MGALWGEVSVEVLSRFLGFVWLVRGSRFVDRGRDDGGVPGRMGGDIVSPCGFLILTPL